MRHGRRQLLWGRGRAAALRCRRATGGPLLAAALRCRRATGGPLLAAALLATFGGPAGRARAGVESSGGQLQTTLSAGFDSFGERYSIDDADTLDFTSELRTVVGLTYTDGWGPGHRLEAHDDLTLSDHAVRNILRFDLDLAQRQRDRLTVANELTLKHFDRSGDYTLASDHLQDILRLAYRAPFGSSLTLRLEQQLELMAFAEPSTYEYDYRRSRSSVALEVARDTGTTVDVEYALGLRAVPDSSAVDYADHAISGGLVSYLGSRSILDLRAGLERRRYRASEVRPGYFYFDLAGRFSVRLDERTELRFRQDAEVYTYDALSEVYFNSLRHLSGIELSYEPTADLRLGFEPRFGYLTSDQADQEAYHESSVVFSGDWIRLDGIWVSGSLELGERSYRQADTDATTSGVDASGQVDNLDDPVLGALLYSDYAFTRVNLFSTYEFAGRYAWNLFVSYEPERHDVESDDTATTLLSTDLTVRF